MGVPRTNASTPNKFACVVKINNHWAAAYCKNNTYKIISEHPEEDIKVAQVAMIAFALLKGIDCLDDPIDLPNPIITILKDNDKWYPGTIYSDRIKITNNIIFKNQAPLDIGGTQEEAMSLAFWIALKDGLSFAPSIGISWAQAIEKDLPK